ncbi:hypothetical protein B0H16DRAFT_1894726 [Mycena metata]|uniref:GATA-type domain-containing protein n=1 Tax=Mycena metata TaxID=1033252 RepID=A0AAD7MQL7_9AGAR|nr:hypothetical protein B0H16DRAFT_1894726 [Mycena metata]
MARDDSDDPEPKIRSTKWADYFEALYAEEEDNEKRRESPPEDSESCGKCGSTTETGMELGVQWVAFYVSSSIPTDDDPDQRCTCDKMPTANNSSHPLGPLLAPPSLLRLVHLSGASPKPIATPTRQCANPNCGSSTSPRWWNSRLLSAKVCNTCGHYERRHHKLRPLSLTRRMRCANATCNQSITNDAHRSHSALIAEGKLCLACGAYETKHGQARPLSLIEHCANVNCGKNIAKATQRYSSVLDTGGMLCSACGQYERKHGEARPVSLINRRLRTLGTTRR